MLALWRWPWPSATSSRRLLITMLAASPVSDVEKGNTTNSQYVAFRLITTMVAFVRMFNLCRALTRPGGVLLLPVIAFLVYKIVVVVIDILHGVDQQHSRLDYAGVSLIMQGFSSIASFTAVFWLSQNLTLAVSAMTVTSDSHPLSLFDWRVASRLDCVFPSISFSTAKKLAIVCFPAVFIWGVEQRGGHGGSAVPLLDGGGRGGAWLLCISGHAGGHGSDGSCLIFTTRYSARLRAWRWKRRGASCWPSRAKVCAAVLLMRLRS